MKNYSEEYSVKKVSFFYKIPKAFLYTSILLLMVIAVFVAKIDVAYVIIPILLGIFFIQPIYNILGSICHHKILEIVYLQKILELKGVRVESLIDELGGDSSRNKFNDNMNF